MAITLDPRAVLAHLNQLGYCNISAEQLRDFMQDLKKLIKYDQQKCTCHKAARPRSPGSSYVETSPETAQSSASLSSSREDHSSKTTYSYKKRTGRQATEEYHKQPRPKSALSAWHVPDEHSSGTDNTSHSSVDSYDAPVKIKHDEATHVKRRQKSKSLENLREATKPRSSFIRPWRLQTATLPHRSDPVALYHSYKILWQQQKVPGEDGHADLRWSVREKMLGQDPHPRPMSQASGREVVFKCRKKV